MCIVYASPMRSLARAQESISTRDDMIFRDGQRLREDKDIYYVLLTRDEMGEL